MTTWLDEAASIDWESFEEASESGKSLLDRLGGDRSLLRRLVFLAPERSDFYSNSGVSSDGGALSIYHDEGRGLHIFLHVATEGHQGKTQQQPYSYVGKVLTGGYDHVWFTSNGQASYVTREQAPGAYGMKGELTHSLSWSPDAMSLIMVERVPNFAAEHYAPLDSVSYEELRDIADLRGVL